MTNYNSIPDPTNDLPGLFASVQALKQAVELLTGQRGTGTVAVATKADLAALSNVITLTGDVTATGVSPLTVTIPNNQITYGKIQQVAAQRLLGNAAGSTANVAELTTSQALDLISSTRGAVTYRGASGWAALAPGTSGYYLQSGGAGADPSWTPVATPNAKATAVAWGYCTLSGTTLTTVNSFGVASVARVGVGGYRVTLSATMANTNYIVVGNTTASGAHYQLVINPTRTTTTFDIGTIATTSVPEEAVGFNFVVFGP